MMQHPDFEEIVPLANGGVGGAPRGSYFDGLVRSRGAALQGWGMTETSPGGTMLKPQMPCATGLRKQMFAPHGS